MTTWNTTLWSWTGASLPKSLLLAACLMLASLSCSAADTAPPKTSDSPAMASTPAAVPFKSLDGEVQSLKKEVLDLNRDLSLLEEELLFPANTQVAVFLSLDVGAFFELDAVQLRLDNKEVANYLYSEREIGALNLGGVHRLFLGNVTTGKHELVAFFTGKGPHGRDYKRGANVTFEKRAAAKFLELRVSDRQSAQQPEFTVREWE